MKEKEKIENQRTAKKVVEGQVRQLDERRRQIMKENRH
jgi:hypothetical protein